jgi:pimeloyl-ACP methyl ester carboxylesterase
VDTRMVETERGAIHLHEAGPEDGDPVVLVHGNLSTGRYFEQVMAAAPDHLRLLAPDMRGFGRTEQRIVDATRGLRDWSDDTAALLDALGIGRPVHLAGWSTGGAAIASFAIDRPGAAASLTFIDPVSPYGFGGVHRDGTPAADDFAGSGGGTGNPDFAAMLADGDRSTDSPVSPLNVMRTSYWSPSFTMDPAFEQVLLDEILLSEIGPTGYPGDSVPSENWPGVAPGEVGTINALSPKYCDWSGIVDLAPKPPVLWVHGTEDLVVADGSAWEMGTLGQMGLVPGWPGEDAFPPQQMVTQIDDVLGAYAEQGGTVRTERFEGSGHGPFLDARSRFCEVFFGFLAEA